MAIFFVGKYPICSDKDEQTKEISLTSDGGGDRFKNIIVFSFVIFKSNEFNSRRTTSKYFTCFSIIILFVSSYHQTKRR